jgi:hypothetical protein
MFPFVLSCQCRDGISNKAIIVPLYIFFIDYSLLITLFTENPVILYRVH